jgi:hydroxyethylthiazole kinase
MFMLDAYALLDKVRKTKPLIHHITNWVTIYDCANMTRAFGALPVMAHADEEVKEMVDLAQALVLNIGTLTPPLVKTMVVASKAANKAGIPVVLDVVGAGATRLRTKSVSDLLKRSHIDILKGNYAEVGSVYGAKAHVRGVESMGLEGDPMQIATGLSLRLGNTVVMTGKTDLVVGGGKTYRIDNGNAMMGSIVGTGCMASSAIGAFAAVEKDCSLASAAALACYGIAGEIANHSSRGPGSFKEAFYDAVWCLDETDILSKIRASCG